MPAIVEYVNSTSSRCGLRRGVVQHPLRYVGPVSENVSQQPGSILREVTPVVIAHRFIRDMRRRSQESVPIQTVGLRGYRSLAPLPREVMPHAARVDHFAKPAPLEDLVLGAPVVRSAALLCTALQNAPAFFESLGKRCSLSPS